MYKDLKRLVDVFVTILSFPFLILSVLTIGPIIYFQDRGKVFYISERLGKDGKAFKMYKFRTMKENSPNLMNVDGSTFNSDNDPRLTNVGKKLRKTSLDELPQLFNVLKGDMSLVGPRPDLPGAIKDYTSHDIQKLKVRPGITGYSQAYYRNSITQEEKFKNDVYYVNNLSFILDILIIFKTISSVLKKANIYN